MSINITIYPKGRGRFTAYLGERPLCKATPTPFYSVARVLLDEGVSPDTVLTMKHKGSSIVSMRYTLGEAARLTVTEEDKKGLRVRTYHPPSSEQGQKGGVSGGYAAIPVPPPLPMPKGPSDRMLDHLDPVLELARLPALGIDLVGETEGRMAEQPSGYRLGTISPL